MVFVPAAARGNGAACLSQGCFAKSLLVGCMTARWGCCFHHATLYLSNFPVAQLQCLQAKKERERELSLIHI